MFILHLTGKPGTGKGAQSALLVSKLGFTHFSVGQLMRDEIDKKTQLGHQIQQLIDKGYLTPPELAMQVIKSALERTDSKKIVFDGFPRTVPQAKAYMEILGKPDLVLHLECQEDVCINRIRNRGGDRVDDSDDVMKNRFVQFVEQTAPAIDFIKQNQYVVTIDATAPIEDVWERVKVEVEDAMGQKGLKNSY